MFRETTIGADVRAAFAQGDTAEGKRRKAALRAHIEAAFRRSAGKAEAAAADLGVSRRQLDRYVEQLDMEPAIARVRGAADKAARKSA